VSNTNPFYHSITLTLQPVIIIIIVIIKREDKCGVKRKRFKDTVHN